MFLPGITREQMILVDQLMVDLGVSVELMMENAGENLARLAVRLCKKKYRKTTFVIIAGSGGNGGGGIVAARRLAAWGFPTEIYFPKGTDKLNAVPKLQYKRAKNMSISIFDELPTDISQDQFFLDCYIGYSFQPRDDFVTNEVFSFLRNNSPILSLDSPSGVNVSTGENYGKFNPIATMTIAFPKLGLLKLPHKSLGDLYIGDIGVPTNIYEKKLGIWWHPPYKISDLNSLSKAFIDDTVQLVSIERDSKSNQLGWKVNNQKHTIT
ncbi:MAG: NAD(P)H-hydrate epimerase [Candidatus Kariarchaeaceae archaeon]|jgi:NAD(P)H-hydrate epimerase